MLWILNVCLMCCASVNANVRRDIRLRMVRLIHGAPPGAKVGGVLCCRGVVIVMTGSMAGGVSCQGNVTKLKQFY